MFSNSRNVSLVFIHLLLASNIIGCIGKVGEAPPPPAAQEFSGTQCMTEALPVLTKYLDGNARPEEVSGAWDCLSLAIEKFTKYVGNDNSDKYTSQELATFIEKNFLDPKENPKVSPALQLELMKVKQIFVGGSRDYVTKAELAKTRAVFNSFKRISLKLNPYVKVFIQEWRPSASGDLQKDMKFFEEANNAGQDAAKELASLIAKNHQAYVLADFENLVAELSKFYGESWESVRQLHKYMPVIQKIKKAIAGGDEGTVASSEWKSFILLGVRGYSQYLRYIFFIQDNSELGTGTKLAYIARTFEDVFSIFQDLVQEKPTGLVSRNEISELLNTFSKTWPDFKISEGSITETMKLKQAIFGGSAESWSTADFESAKSKVFKIKAIFERVLPYYSIYGQEWETRVYDPEMAEDIFSDAQYNLEAAGQEIGTLFEGHYRFADLKNLIYEFELLYPGEDKNLDVSGKLDSYLPLMVRFKNIIFTENDDVIRKESWSPLLRLGARTYSEYLYWVYFVKPYKLSSELGPKYFKIFGQQSLNILRDLMYFKKSGFISLEELVALGLDAKVAGLLPSAVSKTSLQQALSFILNNVTLPPSERLAGIQPNALTMNSVEYIRTEFLNWIESERVINQIFTKTDAWGLLTLADAVKTYESSAIPEESLFAAEMGRVLNTSTAMVTNIQGQLWISNKTILAFQRDSVSKLNLYRMLSRWTLRSLSKEKARIDDYSGFKVAELSEAFKAVKSLIVELELIDASSDGFAESRFREANIFTPRSDGNDLASFEETTDIIGMLFSGIKNADGLKEPIKQACLPARAVLKNATRIKVSCAKKVLLERLPVLLSAMPEFQAYAQKAGTANLSSYLGFMLKAAGYVPNDQQEVKYSDLSLVPHVIQYLEMVFARFDKNKDGFISTPDAMRAFPAFKGLLLELAKKDIADGTITKADLDDVFTFILAYGHPPTTVKEKLVFVLRWRNKPDNWSVWADRNQLASILGFIADEMAKAPKK